MNLSPYIYIYIYIEELREKESYNTFTSFPFSMAPFDALCLDSIVFTSILYYLQATTPTISQHLTMCFSLACPILYEMVPHR